MYHLIRLMVISERPKGLALENLRVNGEQGWVTAGEQDVTKQPRAGRSSVVEGEAVYC